MLCCVFGSLWPFDWISQHRTLLSHEPAIRKFVLVTEGGENRRHEMESSGAFTTWKRETQKCGTFWKTIFCLQILTSKSFIGLFDVVVKVVWPPKEEVAPNEVWPNICFNYETFKEFQLQFITLFSLFQLTKEKRAFFLYFCQLLLCCNELHEYHTPSY